MNYYRSQKERCKVFKYKKQVAKIKKRANCYAAFLEYFIKQKQGFYFQQTNLKQVLINANYTRLLDGKQETMDERLTRDNIKKLRGAFGQKSNMNLNEVVLQQMNKSLDTSRTRKEKKVDEEESEEEEEEVKQKKL